MLTLRCTNANTERIPTQSTQPGAGFVLNQGTLHSPRQHEHLRVFKEPETEAQSHAGTLATSDRTTHGISDIGHQPSPPWPALYD